MNGESIQANSLRRPATAVFDVRFSKEFKVVGINYSMILEVKNVFDARNIVNVYPDGGSSTSTGRADTQQNIDRIVRGGTEYDQDPYNWDYGRQVRLGIDINL